jgi:hypothetical protein
MGSDNGKCSGTSGFIHGGDWVGEVGARGLFRSGKVRLLGLLDERIDRSREGML